MKRICMEMNKKRIRLGWLCSLLLLCWLPVWGQEQTLYIDDGMIVIEDGKYTQGESTNVHTGSYLIKQKTPATPTSNSIIVKGGTHDITLDGVNIEKADDVGETHSAFEIIKESGAVVNLTLEGENVLTAGDGSPYTIGLTRSGIFVPKNTKLTITAKSTGTLIAKGGSSDTQDVNVRGAGIGGCWSNNGYWEKDAGIIEICGGVIEAYGASKYKNTAPDIGVDGTVNITGGIVRFGNGEIEEELVNRTGGIVFIKNQGTIYGESCELPNDLEIKEGDELTISAGITLTNNSTVTNNGCFYNYGNIEGKGDIVNNGVMYLGKSTITPSGEEVLDGKIEGGIAGKDYLFDLSSEGVLMIIKTNEVTALTGDFENWSIDIDVSSTDAPEITLKNVKIDARGRNEFAMRAMQNATLILEPGTQNYLYGDADAAGLLVAQVAQLTIKGTGSLEVESGSGRGAAIGGRYNQNVGVIKIESGNIVAKSKGRGSAIGTGVSGSCKEINISGGELTLEGAVSASILNITGGIFKLNS